MEFQSPTEQQHPKKGRRLWLGVLIVIGCLALLRLGMISHAISIDNPLGLIGITPKPTPGGDPDYAMPAKEANRLNILILGVRGEDDPNAADGGPLLTDSIEVFSYDRTTHKTSLTSIPRDLYITVTGNKKDKLNTAYEYGYYHTTDSLQFIRDKFSEITGTYIDNVVVFDFSSFKKIIDALGGIDVTLDKPFSETQQWGYSFSLPVGPNHLDGQSALYYARSRYSTSDFDRSRRQQQIIFAIKDKVMKLNFLADPVKTFSILNLIRSDVKTDIGIWNIKEVLDLSHEINFNTLQKTVISTDNLLVEGKSPDGAYILLPKSGNFAGVRDIFANSLK